MVENNQNPLARVLYDMNREGQFQAATLSLRDGLLVASSTSNGDDPAAQSAVVAKLASAANVARSQMAISAPEELAFNAEDGRRLICRPFSLNGHELILAVLIPKRGQSYRRATSKAIARLKSVWRMPA
jgi:predicted regulator of Ras-like GTPase activity (Roadblock/LC7/MglB family)